jgi:hypothetical protein
MLQWNIRTHWQLHGVARSASAQQLPSSKMMDSMQQSNNQQLLLPHNDTEGGLQGADAI